MKFQLLQQQSTGSSVTKSPANIFWTILHSICCLISILLGFRFSSLIFFLLSPTSSTILTTPPFAANITQTLSFTTTALLNNSVVTSRVIVGRHGIRVRPWPHPDPQEVMRAHRIIQTVQHEQRVQYGVKTLEL
ncbi:putative 1,4-beta-D-xylan synthase [Helianthus annuus]|uniref:1,4-beta-D-xylan synthase n=1 Tax=Helianthus annuus TaxID=4232 RepID=A0A9K3EBX9_HELAN|nr:putative 1,4-beta-D-xylan synthase [Helianthus annuus]KAJ0464659.1 putative 1,4-beta-D-xylan synthase [Helianthus annuus]KAJ0469291.1 putative 1,4-beta-D-xylan synthase [Helianthus annuus]KAJ0486256.1 putative 1,4-beta-D-xylan synthase [Helianthus annuus]KAJ0656808.1 putative 1,4-beta-D-xylan synthase [Helianthus annuus]